MAVNLTVAVTRIAGGKRLPVARAIRLTDGKGYFMIIAVERSRKRYAVVQAVKAKTPNARARQIDIAVQVDYRLAPKKVSHV